MQPKRTRKEEIEICLNWMFENSDFVRNNSLGRVVNKIMKDLDIEVSQNFIHDNRYKWIKINKKFYEKAKIPYEILKSDIYTTPALKEIIEEI